MAKIKKIDLKKIKKFFTNLPLLLAKKALISFLGLFVLALILGGLIFYRYYSAVQNIEPEISKEFRFSFTVYEEVLSIWREKRQGFENTDSKQYFDVFNP